MSALFYWAVVQAVLIFRVETWVLLDVIHRKMAGVNVGFLNQIPGQRSVLQREWTCRFVAA